MGFKLSKSQTVGIAASVVMLSMAIAFSPAGVIDSMGAAATVVLVAVTAWYVALTQKLVETQNATLMAAKDVEDARLRAEDERRERKALTELWLVCHRFVFASDVVTASIQLIVQDLLNESEDLPANLREFAKDMDEFFDVAKAMTETLPDLPPGLRNETWDIGRFGFERGRVGVRVCGSGAQQNRWF